MISILPDLTPRDCHSLWYVSSRKPTAVPPHLDSTFAGSATSSENGGHLSHGPGGAPSLANTAAQQQHQNRHQQQHQQHQQQQRTRQRSAAVMERSHLGRLRSDEVLVLRRRSHVANFGSQHLKPPGVFKTLFQIREERREAEEHNEAMRREQVAQELAEAEASGAADLDQLEQGGEWDGLAPVPPPPLGMEGRDGELVMETERNLDDDIPDANGSGFGYDGASDEEAEDEQNENDDSDDGDDGEMGPLVAPTGPIATQSQRELAAQLATVRAAEDRMREMMARGQDANGGDVHVGEDEVGEEVQASMLMEEDLVGTAPLFVMEPGLEIDMEADLDDDIPEAENAMYEHTDSEASFSSDEGDDGDQMHTARPPPQAARYRASLSRHSILSRDDSSFLDNSPQTRMRE